MSAEPVTDVYTPQLSIEQMILTFGPDGAAVAAGSITDADAERQWLAVLLPFLGSDAADDGPVVAYIRFTGNWAAALMTRRTGPDTSVTHALAGRADVLTPGIALMLSGWTGWQHEAPDGPLLALSPDVLGQSVDVAGSLRARVLANANRLARVLGWLFQSPAAPLTIVGCPEPDRVPLLWALMELGAPACPGRPWTFWTHAHGIDQWWPDIVFLSSSPDVPGERTVVDLAKEQWPDPEHAHQANRLVFRLKFGYFPDTASGDSSSASAAPEDLSPVGRPAVGVAPAPLPANTTARAARLALVLRDSRNADELERCLRQLEVDAVDANFRRALRTVLAGTDHGAAKVVALVGRARASAVFERVVVVLFGPALVDLESLSGMDQATAFVGDAADERLIVVLARLAKQQGKLPLLASALGVRWTDRLGRGPVERGPVFAALAGVGRLFRSRSSIGQQRLLVAGVVLLLALAFALGFATYRWTVPPQPPTVTGASTAPGPSSSAASPAPSASPAQVPSSPAVAGSSVTGSVDAGTLSIMGTVRDLAAGEKLWLLTQRTNQAGRVVFLLQPRPCLVAADGSWTCTQTADVPRARNGQVDVTVVVRADAAGSGAFEAEKAPPGAPAALLDQLPPGAAVVFQASL